MNQQDKDRLLLQAKTNLRKVREAIEKKLNESADNIKSIRDKLYKLPPSEALVQNSLLRNFTKRTQELDALYPSPYFIKCEIRFDGESVSRIFYFSKFSFPEQNIYSWVSPAAAIRFEQPGKFSYAIKDFGDKNGELLTKEQYMITDGQIIFMTAESLAQPRELIYQEYFSQRKSTFVLPEIVEQMEKAQDKVIRASPQGSFLISGPAGSGKTTLALHRVAYLVQSPDTAEKFKEEDIIVFVQDKGTQAYFAGLLPQLGINNVAITTFADWVREQLKLWQFKHISRFGNTEQEKDSYEFEKYRAIKQAGDTLYSSNVVELLSKIYSSNLSPRSKALFDQQASQQVLDRFDLTLLMAAYLKTHKGIFREDTEYKQLKGGKVQRKKILVPILYSLMVLDEVQNYLPEQINILRQCINKEYSAAVYVGDLAQQTQLCTIKDWRQVGEVFSDDRMAILQKNYRSTKQILEFINRAGFKTSIPKGIKQGTEVKELIVKTKAEEFDYVKEVVSKNPETVVGIIGKSQDYLEDFKQQFSANTNVHVLTINEAQGVEFDVACLVGVNKNLFAIEAEYSTELAQEKQRVNKDLLYVALTRAMNELHIIGQDNITSII